MKINEKTLFAFANTKPSDKEGFLLKRGEVNKAFQRRWFVLKGNLLFYFEKKGDYEPAGCIILEGCIIELAEEESERFCFQLIFHGNRTYVMSAESQETMESWMKALTTAGKNFLLIIYFVIIRIMSNIMPHILSSGYDYMKLLISELQRQLDELDKSSSSHQQEIRESVIRPPRRQNPFNKSNCRHIAILLNLVMTIMFIFVQFL